MKTHDIPSGAPDAHGSSYSPADIDDAYRSFVERHPGYASTAHLTSCAIATTRGSTASATCTSTTPAADCTRSRRFASTSTLLGESVLGNPHSHNPTSLASTQLVEEAREAVLASSTRTPTSTTSSSRPTRAARSSSWASPTRSRPATATC